MKNWAIPSVLGLTAGVSLTIAALLCAKRQEAHKPAVPPEIEQGPVNVVLTNRQVLGRGTNQYGEWVLSVHTNVGPHVPQFAQWSLPAAVGGVTPKLVQARECTNCGSVQGRYFYAEEWRP